MRLGNTLTCALLLPTSLLGFTLPSHIATSRSTKLYNVKESQSDTFDKLLADTRLDEAVTYLRTNPNTEITRDQWNSVFDAIETRTAEAEENSMNLRKEQEQEIPLISKARNEMTDMYTTLKDQGHLRLFGAIDKDNLPIGGSRTVRPAMLEEITQMTMKALTPTPSNLLLDAGVGVAFLEGVASVTIGININFLFTMTLFLALADRVLLNGAVSESFIKVLSPQTQTKITKHEAGHFLCAYLLGCPVEGYVLSAWGALNDSRFGSRGVNAGTSFYDPLLSKQITSNKVGRSSIDRYSIIVMAGIAAEAVEYGRADGGAGDEMALITFLSQMNGGGQVAWNDVTIRNQARWGATQAVMLIREYKECYEALVDALERGGSLGDCIHAIEKAGRDHNKAPLLKPNGFILELPGGLEEKFVDELPMTTAENETTGTPAVAKEPALPIDPEESLRTLQEFKKQMEAKLEDIDEKLGKL